MKYVTAVRHAKSDWGTGLPDIKRPLNRRGRANAPEMGARLRTAGVRPDLLISSPAVRARTTAQMIARELDYPGDAIRLEERLYGAGPTTMIEVLSETDDEFGHVMFFSHNPGITEFVNRIAGARTDNVPTCGVARMEFNVASWNNLHGAKARLIDLDYPKRPAG